MRGDSCCREDRIRTTGSTWGQKTVVLRWNFSNASGERKTVRSTEHLSYNVNEMRPYVLLGPSKNGAIKAVRSF